MPSALSAVSSRRPSSRPTSLLRLHTPFASELSFSNALATLCEAPFLYHVSFHLHFIYRFLSPCLAFHLLLLSSSLAILRTISPMWCSTSSFPVFQYYSDSSGWSAFHRSAAELAALYVASVLSFPQQSILIPSRLCL